MLNSICTELLLISVKTLWYKKCVVWLWSSPLVHLQTLRPAEEIMNFVWGEKKRKKRKNFLLIEVEGYQVFCCICIFHHCVSCKCWTIHTFFFNIKYNIFKDNVQRTTFWQTYIFKKKKPWVSKSHMNWCVIKVHQRYFNELIYASKEEGKWSLFTPWMSLLDYQVSAPKHKKRKIEV